QGVAPWRKVGIALAEQRPHQAPKRLCQRRIGNIALKLIEFAGSEQATRRYQHRLQLVDNRRFSNAGIAANEDQFRRTTIHDAIEGGEQGINLALPSEELLRDHKLVGRVAPTE